jgi:hypothetical protein
MNWFSKTNPPCQGGLPKENFWEFDTSGVFGNYLIYYSVGGSGEGPLKVFDIKNRTVWGENDSFEQKLIYFLQPYTSVAVDFFPAGLEGHKISPSVDCSTFKAVVQ